MYKSSKLVILIAVTLVLLSECECRRTSGSSIGRRGSSRGKNYGSASSTSTHQSSGGFFSSWFGGSSTKTVAAAPKPASNTGTGSLGTGTGSKTSYGWTNPSQGVKPAQTNPSYGWSVPGQAAKPGAVQPGNKQTNYGWTVPQNKKPETGVFGNQQKVNGFQKSNAPSSNIGPNGYPVQQGWNTGGYNRGYNTGGYNTGYNRGYNNPPAYSPYAAPGHTSFGGHSYQPHSFSSHHGFSPSYYPSHTSFGYPGQGLFGGNNLKYKGMGLFGGNSGHYGYPSSGGWGYPSYGHGGMFKSSGKSMLLGAGLGLAGGYLASSLIHRISNPWGYSGYGYGHNYYDRGYYTRYDRYATTPVPPTYPPNPADNWVNCIAFDPTTNQTLINPNCTCSVTTSLDPATNLPVSVHNCTTANGIQLPPMGPNVPVQPLPNNYGMPQQPLPNNYGMPQQPYNGINAPGAVPVYTGLYNENQRYGAALDAAPPIHIENSTSVPPMNSGAATSETGTVADAPESAKQTADNFENQKKVREFYSQLEKIVNMGKFI